MDFGTRLADLLNGTTALSEDDNPLSGMQKWNADVEEHLASPLSSSNDDCEGRTSERTIVQVGASLCRGIVSILLQRDYVSPDDTERLEVDNRMATEKFGVNPLTPCPRLLSEYIRASKNLLRWYIQVFLGHKPSYSSLPSAIAHLQSPSLLELLVAMLEQYTLRDAILDQETGRVISLHLFYATYAISPNDAVTLKALEHLVVQLKFPELALRILTRSCTAALSLSLIRTIHNAVVTLQCASNIVSTTNVEWDASDDKFPDPAPWNPSRSRSLNFRTMCVNILVWAVSSDPPFPGEKQDYRAELVSEILGALYAIRAGPALFSPFTVNDEPCVETIVELLRLPNDNDDMRVIQCKISTISLLMDLDGQFGNYLLEMGAIPHLIDVFNVQVSNVVSNVGVDKSAAAALVPILVVLNKYATAQPEIKTLVKHRVFPPEDEAVFQLQIREQKHVDSGLMKKNMGPLHAPEGSLRRKLCALLTWPESHIKRCTGELLWTICSSNPTEFVHRVGFGNALPLLSLKGFARMPH